VPKFGRIGLTHEKYIRLAQSKALKLIQPLDEEKDFVQFTPGVPWDYSILPAQQLLDPALV